MDFSSIGRSPAKPIPTEVQSVEGFLKLVVDRHGAFYFENPRAEFRPLLLVLCENGDMVPIMAAFDGEDSKDEFCAEMRHQFKEWRVKSYVFAMEAWLSTLSTVDLNEDGSIDDDKRPSKQPDRKEVVFTLAIDRDGNKAKSCLEIHRNYKGEVSHIEPMEGFDGVDFAGRFAELLT